MTPRRATGFWLGVAAALAVAPPGGFAQVTPPAPVAPLHEQRLQGRVEGAVHAALLAEDEGFRDAHVEEAVQVARLLVEADSTSADAFYWLAVALGIKTEFGGPMEKLTTGREVFHTTARVLEMDSLHAGGHELMGRLHAAVMRLPWVVRTLAQGMGMAKVLGHASWDAAEEHYRRARELDGGAIAPRLELAKLYVQRDRKPEARPILRELALLTPSSEVDRLMLEEGRVLLGSLESPGP